MAHRISRKKPGDLKFIHNLLFGRKGKVKSLTQEKTPLDLPDAKFTDYVLPKNLVVPRAAVNMHGNCHSEFPNKLHIEAHLRVFLKKKKHG